MAFALPAVSLIILGLPTEFFFFFMVSWDINNQYLGLQDETNLCQPQKKWEGIKYFNLSLLQPSAILPVSPTGQTQPEGKWQGYL